MALQGVGMRWARCDVTLDDDSDFADGWIRINDELIKIKDGKYYRCGVLHELLEMRHEMWWHRQD